MSGYPIFLFAVGVVAGIVSTWPWALILLPVVVVAMVAFSSATRDAALLAFRAGADSGAERVLIMLFFCAAACLYSVEFFAVMAPDCLQWWIWPLILWAAVFRLCGLLFREPGRSRLARALSDNVFELLALAVFVLTLYSAMLLWLDVVPIDEWTLESIRRFDEGVRWLHEFTEPREPRLWLLLTLMMVIWGLRSAAKRSASLRAAVDVAARFVADVVRWCSRVPTVFALAAGMSLLASGPGGPFDSIALARSSAVNGFEALQFALSDEVDVALGNALVEKALAERPPETVAAMQKMTEFMAVEREYRRVVEVAARRYGRREDVVDGLPNFDLPASPVPAASAPRYAGNQPVDVERGAEGAHWTPRAVRSALAEVTLRRLAEREKGSEAGEDPFEEIGKKELSLLLGVDVLTARSLTEAIKLHSPWLGELLDVVRSSISDFALGELRAAIVKRMTRAWRSAGVEDRDRSARNCVDEQIRDLHFNWSHVANREDLPDTVALTVATGRLSTALAAIRNFATAAQRSDMAQLQQRIRDAGVSAAAPTETPELDELVSLADGWPPLDEPTPDQVIRMDALVDALGAQAPGLALAIETARSDIVPRRGSEPTSDSLFGALVAYRNERAAAAMAATAPRSTWEGTGGRPQPPRPSAGTPAERVDPRRWMPPTPRPPAVPKRGPRAPVEILH